MAEVSQRAYQSLEESIFKIGKSEIQIFAQYPKIGSVF